MVRYSIHALFSLILAGQALAAYQDPDTLREQANRWLLHAIERAYPDTQAKVETGFVDARLRLPTCPAPQFALPSGGRYWGNGSIEARCVTPQPWRLYINYRIRLSGPALTTRHALAARAQIRPGDVETRLVTYDKPPEAYLRTLPGEVYASRPLPTGQPLTLDSLVLPPLVQAGRPVRVVVQGRGFDLTQQGTALATAGAGQQIKVRIAAGHIIQATVRGADTVEISP